MNTLSYRPAGLNRFVLACSSVLLVASFAAGQAPPADDPNDPLSFLNQLDTKAAAKAPPPEVKHLTLSVQVEPRTARPGEIVRLTIRGKVDPGFHTYPVAQRTLDVDDTVLTHLTYEDGAFRPIWTPIVEEKPEFEREVDDTTQFVFTGDFKISQDILVEPGAKPGPSTLRLDVSGQVCDKNACTRYLHYPLEAEIEIGPAGPAITVSPDVQERLKASSPDVKIVEPQANESKSPVAQAKSAPAKPTDTSLSSMLLVSMGAAFLMLLTPCVFPMIPITVSFFLKQSEKEHHNALLTAAVYSVTIVILLSAAMLLLGSVIVELANSLWLNLGMGLLLAFFALSLFGMYEIELPSGLARFTAAHEGKGGYIGAFFMALTFAITSFSCTGPFLGPLLIGVKELQLGLGRLVLISLVYSATFAAPFFVLALFPRLLKSLPKSGGWLNAVKVVMGFLELALALKFLGYTDLVLHPGNALFFNYETVLCGWIALSVCCGLYLFGIFRLPHDTPVEHVGVVRMLLASMFLGLAVYMVPALWRITPQGTIGQAIVAFLPWDSKEVQHDLVWSRDYEEAWNRAVKEKKLIFIDFTGINCTNCRANEKGVFVLPSVKKEFEKYILVQLYTDRVPDKTLEPAQAAAQADRNRGWQEATFNDVSNPFYAIMKPKEGEKPIVNGENGIARLNGADPQWTRKGFIPNDKVADFEQFLKNPQASVDGGLLAGAITQAGMSN
jgi:thiol:disulfide interchange protein DsbD